MQLRVIDGETVRAFATPERLIGWMREAMLATSTGRVELPLRRKLDLPDGMGAIGVMPGYVEAVASAGVKLVSLVPSNRRRGSSHLGMIVLYDAEGLVPVSLLCGSTITALRTAAVVALATDTLARPDARRLTILGTGEQAVAHLEALPQVREFDDVRIWGRTAEKAEALAADFSKRLPIRSCPSVEEAVVGTNVVCTVTSSPVPILAGRLISDGCHVNLVGSSTALAAETDDELVRRSRFVVDYRPSALDQAGELFGAIMRRAINVNHIAGELGEVLAGRVEGRQSADQVTVYKSLGIAAQDIVTARHVYARASEAGRGTMVQL